METATQNSQVCDDLKIAVVTTYMQRKVTEAISQHEEKIEQIQAQLNQGPDEVLERKLEELKLQQATFERECNRLFGMVQLKQGDLKRLQKSFDNELTRFSLALPIYAYQNEIVDMVRNHQVSVLIGDTGSGKSTQICQFIYEHNVCDADRMIICTQPRKVAAMSLAAHVSKEMKENVGKLVGYHLGSKRNSSKTSKIIFATDHTLLNDCLQDPLFSQYSVIIIDEAHERSLYTDLLISLVKDCVSRRPDLRVLITSATIDPKVFQDYFGSCPVLRVPGRMYPVEVVYEPSSCLKAIDKYIEQVVTKIRTLHETKGDGDILAFVVTPIDCEKCCEALSDLQDAQCLPLHGQLNAEQYQNVFTPLTGSRKIVIATNCAETSVTIPGIKYVVDSGLVKEKCYDGNTNASRLVITMISRSAADQRKGRAGRVEPGECFRLYNEVEYEQQMKRSSVPEILRMNLRQAILYLVALGISDPLLFDFVESPDRETLRRSFEVLQDLGAISIDGGLSDLGKQMVCLPVDPRYSKFILMCCESGLGYTGIAMTVMCMQGSLVFYRGSTEEERIDADAKKGRFVNEIGDAVTLLGIFNEWRTQPDQMRTQWCVENSINAKLMRNAFSISREVHNVLNQKCGITVHREIKMGTDLQIVLRHYVLCFFPDHICYYSGYDRIGYFVPQLQTYCQFHPSSVLKYYGDAPKIALYEGILETTRKYLIGITRINPEWCPSIAEQITEEYEKHMLSFFPICTLGETVAKKLYRHRHDIKNFLNDYYQSLIPVPQLQWSSNTTQSMGVCMQGANKENVLSAVNCHFVEPILNGMLNEITEKAISDGSDVKVVIGSGGIIKACVMFGEHRSIKITLKRAIYANELDVSTISDILRPFGEIIHAKPVKNNTTFWGYLTFLSPQSAEQVVQRPFEKFDCVPAETKPTHRNRAMTDGFQGSIYCEWMRLAAQGHAYVVFADGVLDQYEPITESFFIDDSFCVLTRSRNPNSLYIKYIPKYCTKEMIVKNGPSILQHNERIVIPAVKELYDVEHDQNNFRETLVRILTENKIPVSYLNVLNKSKRFLRAFINLTNLSQCLQLYDRLTLTPVSVAGTVSGLKPIKFSLTLNSTIHISCMIYTRLKAQILSMVDALEGSVEFKPDNYNKMGRLYIKSNDKDKFTVLGESIGALVMGHPYKCDNTASQCLLIPEQHQTLEDMMDETGTYIEVDHRVSSLVVYGEKVQIQKAHELLEAAVANITLLIEFNGSIPLRGPGKPACMLRSVLKKYGVDLKPLQRIDGCVAIKLNLQGHKIIFSGTYTAYERIYGEVNRLANDLSLNPSDGPNTLPDCPICLVPVDVDNNSQLSICGHRYCKECLEAHYKHMISDRKFPLQCAAEGCNQVIYLYDLELDKELLKKTVEHWVATNNKEFKFCQTPDCLNFYRITTVPKSIYCSLCHRSTCCCCHKNAHPEDILCSSYSNPDHAIKVWMNQDPSNRKQCPKCKFGIEKDGGCLHIHCIKCNAHICWNCNKYYATGEEVYGHQCNA